MPRKTYTMKMVEDKPSSRLKGILKFVIIAVIILVIIAVVA
jgi:hypothetical protein